MKISIEKLREKSSARPTGYFEEVIASGKVKDGWLYLDSDAYRRLLEIYNPPLVTRHTSHITGLGDAVALVAKPVARAIDRAAGTNLENCKPCAARRAKLNAVVPF